MHTSTILPLCRVPPCFNTALGYSATRRFIRVALYNSSQGSQRVRLPHSNMVVSGHGPAMYAENLYEQWVCTRFPSGALYRRGTARGTSTLLARGTERGRPLAAFGDVLPGWVILTRILRRNRQAIPLAVHPYGVRLARTSAPGCRAGMRSLRSDQPRARMVFCAVGVHSTERTTTITCYDWR